MGTVAVTIKGTMTGADGGSVPVTVQGDLWLTNLAVGGGPSPGGPGTPPPPGSPTFPIWGPPGIDLPGTPGYPPVATHPLPPLPPPANPDDPKFVPVWHPDLGWIVIPTFPIPTPSKKK